MLYMKNHFLYSYLGNKRNETKQFLDNIKLDDIKNIIEPFCGSSAISFSIWLNNKDKNFNYYLNDSDKKLIEVYDLMKNETIEEIEKKINEFGDNIHNKEEWKNEIKNNDNTIYSYIFFKKFSALGRYGFYPLEKKKFNFKISKETKEFIEFIKQPNVYITHGDWFEVFDKFKNDKTSLFMIDPPYIMACNDFYTDKKLNMYQYFYDNKIENFKSHIYLILEDNWIIRCLFANNKILLQYAKKYEISKKQTNHIIIYNYI